MTGAITAEEVRRKHTEAMRSFSAGEPPESMQRLLFEVARAGTSDEDRPTIEE